MSEQFFDNNDNKNNEYHFTGDQLNQTVINDTPPTGGPDSGTPNHESRKPKTKKPMTMGKKWAVVVSMALVFGLIAGGTMFGVNTVGNLITGAGRSNVQLAQTSTTSSSGTSSSSDSGSGTVTEVAANAMPSLVTISTMTVEEMQNFFGGTQQYEVEGAGTGVIVGENDTELLIATNYHVVEGANSLSVGFIDETSVEAEIKGTDVNNDLAVVAVKLSDIPDDTMNQIKIATIGDSDELQLGDQVVAIGNALGYGQSVTNGIVSAKDREISGYDGTLIQTNAAINPGNSGGALLNTKGEVIGINCAKISDSSVEGMGYAIPVSEVSDIIQNLMNQQTKTRVSEEEQGSLGVQVMDIDETTAERYGMPQGVYITGLTQDNTDSDLQRGYIITALNGTTISDTSDLQNELGYYRAGEDVTLTVQSAGSDGEYTSQDITVTLISSQSNQ